MAAVTGKPAYGSSRRKSLLVLSPNVANFAIHFLNTLWTRPQYDKHSWISLKARGIKLFQARQWW
jgi:hypothetical protein